MKKLNVFEAVCVRVKKISYEMGSKILKQYILRAPIGPQALYSNDIYDRLFQILKEHTIRFKKNNLNEEPSKFIDLKEGFLKMTDRNEAQQHLRKVRISNL